MRDTHVLPTFGEMRLDEITKDAVRDFFAEKKKDGMAALNPASKPAKLIKVEDAREVPPGGRERPARDRPDGVLKKAKMRRIRFHDTRHTFASLLLRKVESPVYVQHQLGHHDISMTVGTYGHLIPGENRQAVNRLDDPDWGTRGDGRRAPGRGLATDWHLVKKKGSGWSA